MSKPLFVGGHHFHFCSRLSGDSPVHWSCFVQYGGFYESCKVGFWGNLCFLIAPIYVCPLLLTFGTTIAKTNTSFVLHYLMALDAFFFLHTTLYSFHSIYINIYKCILLFYKKMEVDEMYAQCGGYTGTVAAGKQE